MFPIWISRETTEEPHRPSSPKNRTIDSRILGPYEEIDFLGSGSFGYVVEVKLMGDSSTVEAKTIAVKTVDEEYGKLEIQILEKLKELDPTNKFRCVQMLSSKYNDEEKVYYISFPVLGLDLMTYMQDDGQFNLSHVRIISYQILTSLKFLHSNHIVHGDVKPENILFEDLECWEVLDNGNNSNPKSYRCYIKKPLVKLSDFGLAVSIDSDYNDKKIIQTRPYRAPEIILSQGWNEKSDIWAYGLTMFNLWKRLKLVDLPKPYSNTHHIGILDKVFGPFPKCMATRSRNYFNRTGRAIVSVLEKKTIADNCYCVFEKYDTFKNADTESLFSLMRGMLELCPNKRFSATDALEHPFFMELRNNKDGIFRDLLQD